MKKLSAILCSLMAFGGLVASAEPFEVHINVDDASHVKLVNSDTQEVLTLTNGDNVLTFESTTYCELTGVDPWGIKEVMNIDGGYKETLYSGTWYGNFYGAGSYSITTYNVEESRTATATINIDEPEKVLVQRTDGSVVTLASGENAVKFNPETDSPLRVARCSTTL